MCGIEIVRAVPQPSGWACDHKEQPSARGRLRAAAASGKPQFKMKNERLKMSIRNRAAACEGTARADAKAEASCGPSRGEAAARCARSGRKFMIQNSRFKIRWGCRAVCIPIRDAVCGELAQCGPAGRELRASAAPGLRPAAPYERKFIIQNSRFKIRWGCRTRLGLYLDSGCSLRSARMFGYELRASAAPRLRPANPYGIE